MMEAELKLTTALLQLPFHAAWTDARQIGMSHGMRFDIHAVCCHHLYLVPGKIARRSKKTRHDEECALHVRTQQALIRSVVHVHISVVEGEDHWLGGQCGSGQQMSYELSSRDHVVTSGPQVFELRLELRRQYREPPFDRVVGWLERRDMMVDQHRREA